MEIMDESGVSGGVLGKIRHQSVTLRVIEKEVKEFEEKMKKEEVSLLTRLG